MENSDIVTQLTNLVIRPHRQIYGLDRLGSKKILVKSKLTKHFIHALRKDCTLSVNKRIQLSIFEPEIQVQETQKQQSIESLQKQQNSNEHLSSVKKAVPNFSQIRQNSVYLRQKKYAIFLHSNSGSRLQGIQYAKYLLQYGISVVVFDYCGSGISEGQYVTMGVNESQDLHQVFNFIKQNYGVQKVMLWGRSMGAVTAIIYASKYPSNIIALTLDSPFSSFSRLINDLAKSKTGLPNFLFSPIISRIQSQIKQKTGCNLFTIDLQANMYNLKSIPCLFLTSKHDQLVPFAHTEQLYKSHQGVKDIIYLEGHHNEPRSLFTKEKCAQFLYQSFLQKIQEKETERPTNCTDKQYIKVKASIRKHIDKQNQKISFEQNYEGNNKKYGKSIKIADQIEDRLNGGKQVNKRESRQQRKSEHKQQHWQINQPINSSIKKTVPYTTDEIQEVPNKNLSQKSGFSQTVDNFLSAHFIGHKVTNQKGINNLHTTCSQEESCAHERKKNTKITLTNKNINQLNSAEMGLQRASFINNVDGAYAITRSLKQEVNRLTNPNFDLHIKQNQKQQKQQKLNSKCKNTKLSLSQFKKSTFFNGNIDKNNQIINGSNNKNLKQGMFHKQTAYNSELNRFFDNSGGSQNSSYSNYDNSDHSNYDGSDHFRSPLKTHGFEKAHFQCLYNQHKQVFSKENASENKKPILNISNVPIRTSIIYQQQIQSSNDQNILVNFCRNVPEQIEDSLQMKIDRKNDKRK